MEVFKLKNRIFGYARVSSKTQNLDRQIEELKKYVEPEYIVTDKASGKDLERPGYMALKGVLGMREGDTLVVHSLDRLSRSKADIKKELEWFRSQQIRLMVLDLPTTLVQISEGQEWILDMVNNILIEVISSIAEQERVKIQQRQKEGIQAAHKKGKHLGRPSIQYPDNWNTYYPLWKDKKILSKTAMEQMGLKKSSFYKLVSQQKKEDFKDFSSQ